MIIILPESCQTLAFTEKSLNNFSFANINQHLHQNNKVLLEMPKFKIESSLNLDKSLKKVSKRTI